MTPRELLQIAAQLHKSGKLSDAESLYRGVLAADPANADATHLLGIAALERGQIQIAEDLFNRAISLSPAKGEYHHNLGLVRLRQNKLTEAVSAFRNAVALSPSFAEGYESLAYALTESDECSEAAACCRRALEINPNLPQAHYNLAMILLRSGDWERGWEEFEWRLKLPSWKGRLNPYTQPRWDGSELRGRRILLHCEQGLGDTIQYLRYVPMVVQRGGKVLVAVPERVLPLVNNFGGAETWLKYGDPAPPVDLQCPLPSLPRLFKTTPANIPANTAYLKSDPTRAEKWRTRFQNYPRPLIGLSWTGSRDNTHNVERSIPLSSLSPLAAAAGTLFSLQMGVSDAASSPMPMIVWTGERNDLADEAAFIANLDLVVTVDTMIAHLAGAIGKPVFILLRDVADWRWLTNRTDTPWYSTARLFRQDRRDDWAKPIREVCDALRAAARQ